MFVEAVGTRARLLNDCSACGKERRMLISPGDLPRQHPFGTTLRFTDPVLADSP